MPSQQLMCLSAQSPNARAEEIADASQSRTAPIFGAPATAFNSNSKQDFTCRKAPSAILHRQPVQFRIDCGVPCPTFQRYWLLRFSLRRLPGVSCCSWLQHRSIIALALWGAGFITASIATTLIIVARGTIPDFWSIVVGNAVLAAAYGILWCGARKFEGKKASTFLAMLGVLL